MALLDGKRFLYLCVLTVNLLGLTAGILLTWSSPVLPKLTDGLDDNPFGEKISVEEGSWIGSLLALGACFGPPLSGYLADKVGRKKTLLFLSAPFIIALFVLAFAKTIVLYYIARFLAGLSVGSTFVIVPMYIAECAESSTRGTLGSLMNVFVTAGTLFSYVIGAYVPLMWFCIICAIIPSIFAIAFFLYVPESPYYLTKQNSLVSAEAALRKYRSGRVDEIKAELAEIRNSLNSTSDVKLKDIFTNKGTVKALIISLSLMAFQQFSGINIILFYAQQIFDASGSSIPPEICSIIVGVTQVTASFITPIFVDKAGRRLLLLISAFGMLVFEVVIGVYFYMQSNNQDVSSLFWLPVTCLVGYILTYNTGFGPLPWVVMAEVFPDNVKSFASAFGGSFCWFLGFMLTKFFSNVTESIGLGGSFWFFSAFNVVAIAFIFLYMPETKGKSLHEVLTLLNS